MQKSLDHADRIAKLALSIGVIIAYLLKLTAGPFAFVLLTVSLLILIMEVIKLLVSIVTKD